MSRFQWSLRATFLALAVLAVAAAILGRWLREEWRDARMIDDLYRQLENEARTVSVVQLAEQPGYRIILSGAKLSRKSIELMASWPALAEIVMEGEAANAEAEMALSASFIEWHSKIGSMKVFQRTKR